MDTLCAGGAVWAEKTNTDGLTTPAGKSAPEPVFDARPGWVDFYHEALRMARAHVVEVAGMPRSPYMDEGFAPDTLWIWDTCFMALFCRYAPDVFPGVESLENFYGPMHGGLSSPLKIQHPDNPPLFAWVERENFRLTGDLRRVRWLLHETQALQKHFHWFDNLNRGDAFPWARIPSALRRGHAGFQWSGMAAGMDNSPRFDGPNGEVDGARGFNGSKGLEGDPFVVDALAQQGLAARCIAELAREAGELSLTVEYEERYERIRHEVNTRHWDEADGFYYDRAARADGSAGGFSRVRTPASFWPVLAGMASSAQVERMAAFVRNADELGGEIPWPSVSRSHPGFDNATGEYWRGAVWLPTAYMGIKALSENGHGALADETAERVLSHMYRTWKNYEPATIWECYDPNLPRPSTHRGSLVRPDFCGWSALGPISLFIEHVLGFHAISATQREVHWRLHQTGRHGIRRLRFGDIETDIVYEEDGSLFVKTSCPYRLHINGHVQYIRQGTQRFRI
ncbi:glycogen debranching enzyme [Opitutaceae bacterium TAV1]|nr:glycogen debranching enzyme [Opitutaceae bacterium TAV1]